MKKRHKFNIALKLIVRAMVTIILAIKNDNFEEPIEREKKRKPKKEKDNETSTPTDVSTNP